MPAEKLIAVEFNHQVVFYHPYGTPSLGTDEIVMGTVERVEQVPCPEYPCFGQGTVSQITLVIAEVWQSLQGIEGKEITILQGDSRAAPAVESTIVALIQPSTPIPERGIPRYFWIDPQFLYMVEDNRLVPLAGIPDDEPLLTVDQARTAVIEIFAGVCLTPPPPIPSPTVRLPGTPFPTAIPPRKQC